LFIGFGLLVYRIVGCPAYCADMESGLRDFDLLTPHVVLDAVEAAYALSLDDGATRPFVSSTAPFWIVQLSML